MPEYLRPGVYIEETSFRARPIQGVSTSTAGFVGTARRGREGRAELVTNFAQFRRDFGDPISPPTGLGDYLGHGVKAFFENGGSRCYVVRVLPGNATSASQAAEQGTVLRLSQGITVRGPTDTVPLNSLRSVSVNTVLRVFTRPNAAAPFVERGPRTVTAYDSVRNRVTVTPAIPTGVAWEPNNTFFLPPQGAAPAGAPPTFEARNRGDSGRNLSVLVRPTDLPPVALRTSSAQRDNPTLDPVAAPIAAGAVDVEMTAAALQRLRSGDTIDIGSAPSLTIASIDPAELTFPAPGGAAVDHSAGGTIALVSRFGAPAFAQPLPLGPFPAGSFNFTAVPPPTQQPLPHDIAVFLKPRDVIRLQSAAGSTDLTVTTVRLAEEVAAGAHLHLDPATPVQTAQGAGTPVRLVATSDTDRDRARLIVGSVAGFAPGAPIAVSNGAVSEASVVLLADPDTNSLVVRKANPAVAGQFPGTVTVANWLSVESLRVAANNDTTLPVTSTASFYGGAIVELDTGTQKIPGVVASVDAAARTVTLTAGLALPGGGPLEVPADRTQRGAYLRTLEIEIQVFENEIIRETFPNLSWNPDPAVDSFRRYYVDRINDEEVGSRLVRVNLAAPPGTGLENQPTSSNGLPLALATGGSNGSALTAVDLIGRDDGPGQRTGIQALAERDDIAIVAVPGVTEEIVQQELITHCERLRYRMAVLDGRINTPRIPDIQAHRNNYDSRYAAYYAPWLRTLDLVTGRIITVPPSGYVIGIYARTDQAVGVHKAPANEVVRNIVDVEFRFTDGEQEVANPVGINLIRDLTPRGIRVWGARTISSDSEWRYVNVRRLFIFLEHSIDLGTQWVVFEPNSEALWARVVETITSFLIGVWKRGALMGTTPDQAFFVRCDRTTMTQDDIDNGRLVCEIGVAPVYPAEFVIFRIGQFTASATT